MISTPVKFRRPALSYQGGKFMLRKWLHTYFPDHDAYFSIFGGAASDLLGKPCSAIEQVSDLHAGVINYFTHLRDSPAELIAAINGSPATSEELERCWIDYTQPFDRTIESARCMYISSVLTYSGAGTRWNTKLKGKKVLAQRFPDGRVYADYLMDISGRLRRVEFFQRRYQDAIAQATRSRHLIYADPTYLNSTRGGKDNRHVNRAKALTRNQYLFELCDEQHQELAVLLRLSPAMVVLSGYPSEMYRSLYRGWYTVSQSVTDQSGARKPDTIWLNPLAHANLRPAIRGRLQPV